MRIQLSTMATKKEVEIDEKLAKLSRVESGVFEQRQFVLVREREIKELELALQSKSGSKRTFQTLPRFERRRIMSQNIHVIPKHLRAAAQKEMQVCRFFPSISCRSVISTAEHEKLPGRVNQRKKRKIRRRKILKLEKHRLLAQDSPLIVTPKSKRLETHIFHAKRMHMSDCWGFRLAIQSSLKIYRVAYRFLRQHVTIHDASYLVCLQLEGSKQQLVKLFSRMTPNFIPRHDMYTSGTREGSFIMHETESKQDFTCLGPVKFLWKQQQVPDDAHRSCWMWLHPASIPQAYPFLQRISAEEKGMSGTSPAY